MPPRKSKSAAKSDIQPTKDVEGMDFTPIEISARTRKQDVVEAYEELLERFQQSEEHSPAAKRVAQRTQEDDLVTVASQGTVAGVVASVAQLKTELVASLDSVSQRLAEQTGRFTEISTAIQVQKTRLREIHDVEVAADSLAMLVERHQQEEQEFRIRMQDQQETAREAFETTKAEVLEQVSEAREAWQQEVEDLGRSRTREFEEYDYNLKQQRKRDADSHEAKKNALEKQLADKKAAQEHDLGEREAKVKTAEEELSTLRAQVDAYEAKLQKAVSEAAAAARKEAKREADMVAELQKRVTEGQQQVAELQIKTLDLKVTEQAARIAELTSQLAEATNKVENIATKAIEGASNKIALSAVNDIALQQARKTPHN